MTPSIYYINQYCCECKDEQRFYYNGDPSESVCESCAHMHCDECSHAPPSSSTVTPDDGPTHLLPKSSDEARDAANESRNIDPVSTFGDEPEADKRGTFSTSDSGDDDVSDGGIFSVVSDNSTAASSISPNVQAGVVSFIDLLLETVDVQQLINSKKGASPGTLDRIQHDIRNLVKLFSRDLLSELQGPDSQVICNFFRKASREIASSICPITSKAPSLDEAVESQNQNMQDDLTSDSSATEPEPETQPRQDFTKHSIAVASSDAFRVFKQSLYDVFNPSFESRLKLLIRSQIMVNRSSKAVNVMQDVASELLYSSPCSFSISQKGDRNLLHLALENMVGLDLKDWDLWPLPPRRSSLGPEASRLEWKCVRTIRTFI